MRIANVDVFIQWAENRMTALDNEIVRDFGGGMTNKLGHYNELKTIKEMFERGCFMFDGKLEDNILKNKDRNKLNYMEQFRYTIKESLKKLKDRKDKGEK